MSLCIRVILFWLFSVPIWCWGHVRGTELQKLLSAQKHTLVAFIGSENAQSQLLDTEWANVADAENTLLSIDCAIEAKFCDDHDVRTFPAIRLYRSEGKVFDHYRGPRLASKIQSFVKRSLRPTVSGLVAENATEFSSIDDSVFVLHLTKADAEKGLYKRFHDLATKFRDRYSFGVVWAKEPDVVSTLDCYNNLDEVQRSTQKVFESFNSLKSFFEICTARLVPEMTHENKGYFTEGKRNVLYHFDFHHDDRLRYSMNVRETAKKHINDLEFVTVDPVNFPEMLANLGLQWNFPAIALQDKNRGLTFPSKRNENITPDMVEDLIRSVTDGSARPAFQGPVNSATKDENTNADTRSEKMLSHDEL